MTFNELVAWIVAKPHGRIRIESDGANRRIVFYLSCQLPSGAVVGIEQRIERHELQFLGSKEAVEAEIGRRFDSLREDFDDDLDAGRSCRLPSGHQSPHNFS